MSLKKNVVGFIPARLHSVRLQEKLLQIIDGKPLIQWTYENAQKFNLDSLVIATDSDKIYDVAKSFNAEVIMTSKDCKNGTERIAEAIGKYNFENEDSIIVNIQGDEPNIDSSIIDKISDALVNDCSCQMSTACVKITNKEDVLNPSIVKCVFNTLGHALLFSRAMIPYGKLGEYNPKNSYYRHYGIYAYKKDFLKLYTLLPDTPLQIAEDLEQLKVLEHGYCIKVIEVDKYSYGIDTQEDLDNFIKVRKST